MKSEQILENNLCNIGPWNRWAIIDIEPKIRKKLQEPEESRVQWGHVATFFSQNIKCVALPELVPFESRQ